jgi:hypothetical protein
VKFRASLAKNTRKGEETRPRAIVFMPARAEAMHEIGDGTYESDERVRVRGGRTVPLPARAPRPRIGSL